jgi:hypothetical protein
MFNAGLPAPVAAAPFGRIGPRHQGRRIAAFGLEFGPPQEQDALLSLIALHFVSNVVAFPTRRISSSAGHRGYASTSVERDRRVGKHPYSMNDRLDRY